jgi:triosephosphate isomerase
MRRPMVAGNWKMNGSRATNTALLADLERRLKPEWPIDVAVFPPFVYLPDAVRALEDGTIVVGAQNVCAEASGAFTGEVAAAMLKDVGCSLTIIAYEPVWAIGTGRTASPEQAQAVHAFIRHRVAEQNARIASQMRILYGGSVKAGNAADLFSMPDVDGSLVGGASLSADEFYEICAAAAARH